MRMTNLLTVHTGIPLHFLRVDGSGAISRVYENDDLPVPMDVTGSVEGQIVCRKFLARSAFEEQNRTTEHYQYTDTPSGTFWCSTQTGHHVRGRVLDHRGRALRRRAMVPRPRDAEAGRLTLPRRVLLPAARHPRWRAAGRARPGRARGCTCRCSRRCLAARSRASTTTRSTRSSTGTPDCRDAHAVMNRL